MAYTSFKKLPKLLTVLFDAFQETDVFQFEMDESQLSNVLSSIDEIEKKLESYAQWTEPI